MPPKLRRELRAGDQLGAYVVEQRLAEGGMAEVFVGRDTRSGTPVALKRCLVKPATAQLALEMFEREARIARTLFHPHIVTTYELLDDVDGNPVLIMELLQGASVERVAPWLRRAPDRTWLIGEVLAGAARALDYVHDATDPDTGLAGLVHRDVSPDNLFVTRDGMVKLIDFGLAKQTDDARLTRVGLLKGKAAFLAPEQVAGNVIVDRRVDQYALATVAYWLFAGVCPFERDNVAATLDAIQRAPLVPLASRLPELPAAIDEVLARALHREREQRFPSCLAFVEALRAASPSPPTGAAALPRLAALARSAEQGRPPSVAVAPVESAAKSAASDAAPVLETELATDPRQGRPVRTLPDGPPPSSDIERTFVEPAPISAEDHPGPSTSTESSPARVTDTPSGEETEVVGPRGDEERTLHTSAVMTTSARRLPWAAGAFVATLALVLGGVALQRALQRGPEQNAPDEPSADEPGAIVAEPLPDAPKPTAEPAPPTDAMPVIPAAVTPPTPRRMKLLAPPHIEWSTGTTLLGRGSLEVDAPAEGARLTALDTRRRVASTMGVADVVNYEDLPATRVRIFVRPWAEVTLGDEALGVTPLPALSLVHGTYRLRLLHEGEEQVHSIEVADTPLELRYRFGDQP